MAKKRRRTRSKERSFPVISNAAGLAITLNHAEPFGPAVKQLMGGDVQGAITAGKAGAKASISQENLVDDLKIGVMAGVIKGAAKIFGVNPSFKLGKWRIRPLS